MKKKKGILKAKEPVRIRTKELSNGNQSIYLDTYQEGKRSYRFLKLYLIPETTPQDKLRNQETMRAAEAMKAQAILDLTNGKAGIKKATSSKLLLADWMQAYCQDQEEKGKKTLSLTNRTARFLQSYRGPKVRLQDIDADFVRGFIHYLTHTYRKSNGTPLTRRSANHILCRLNSALNAAVRRGLIKDNPCNALSTDERIRVPESRREYLTMEEYETLRATPCGYESLKRAFLFACCCGLRISDLRALTWDLIERDGDRARAKVIQQKTQRANYVPLNNEALRWLPEREGKPGKALVFDLPSIATMERQLDKWTDAAGISKHITFHSSRHTFATMMLTLGADLYTTSKLLGHTNVSTTQIYAKIIDKKKEEAVDLMNNLFK